MSDKIKVVAKRIGELLVDRGVITQSQLTEALNVQKKSKKLLGEILIELGYATEEEVMICLTTQYGIPYLPIESYEIDQDVISSVSSEMVHKYQFVPVDKLGNLLTIVTSDIIDNVTLSEIGGLLNLKIQSFVTTPTALRKAIEKYYKL
jgi:type IV pilus assembly protein PilB